MEMGMPITDTEYYSLTMAKLPEVKQGSEYKVKKGDSLWSIAKEQLGSKAKKSDILDYTYRIAKLNNYDSIQKMNTIKVNDKILLPEVEKPKTQTPASNKPSSQAQPLQESRQSRQSDRAQSNTQSTLSSQNNSQVSPIVPWDGSWQYQSTWSLNQTPINVPFASQKAQSNQKKTSSPKVIRPANTPASPKAPAAKPQEKPKSNARLGFEDVRNKIMNTNIDNLSVSSCEAIYSDIYTVYRMDPKNAYIREQIATFIMDKKNNLKDISFNGRTNEMSIRYDYTVDRTGKVTQSDEFGIETKVVERFDKKQMLELEKVLQRVVTNAERKYD